MGHESAGEVIAVGDRVTTHKVGDRVAGELGSLVSVVESGMLTRRAVEPGLPCRRCINCKNGRMNICTGEFCYLQ